MKKAHPIYKEVEEMLGGSDQLKPLFLKSLRALEEGRSVEVARVARKVAYDYIGLRAAETQAIKMIIREFWPK
jgi:hypothetical protein